ncbi:recombinase family protein [Kitasatospora mediocidica]|uniref:recombinase family protein n=1 Tax=Kitasatospora mediocidica TaxID=58352 RepID=UPI000A82DBF4|nr:recombinase family protein [Kitasatospora mediocidica]
MTDHSIITPGDAALIRRINRLYLSGLTAEEIAEELNEDGISNDLFYRLNPMTPRPVSS